MASSVDPGEIAQDAALRDGTTVRVRHANTGDLRRVEDYLIGLSDETRRLRFGSATVDIGEVARRVVSGNGDDHLALLALHGGDDGTIVGGAQYFRLGDHRAEVSLSVADAYQRRGLGTLLLARLAAAAEQGGIERFVAYVAPANHRMIEVFRDCGFDPTIRARPGSVEVEFPTEITEDAARSFEEREREAARNAVAALLSPGSVAVIGASRDPASIGARVFRNILRSGFQGVVHPVNPKASAIEGVAAFPSVLDVPGDVDLAIVCVPAPAVLEVAASCGSKGVRGLVVITSGFSETGEAGRALQDELLVLCRTHGMRLIGPNCMGILNTDPEISLNATFAPGTPLPGRVGFMSQSGALGIAVIEHANQLGLGLSSFVSAGNKADISGNDLLAFWQTDPRTEVVMLYLESFGNPRRFSALAREISQDKAIVAVKSGRSAAGMRATASHGAGGATGRRDGGAGHLPGLQTRSAYMTGAIAGGGWGLHRDLMSLPAMPDDRNTSFWAPQASWAAQEALSPGDGQAGAASVLERGPHPTGGYRPGGGAARGRASAIVQRHRPQARPRRGPRDRRTDPPEPTLDRRAHSLKPISHATP